MSIGEKQKEKSVEIAMDVINETNKYESMYLNNLQGETLSEPSSFEETKWHLIANRIK
jgi:hypothetical protein